MHFCATEVLLFWRATLRRDVEVDLDSHRFAWICELDDVDFSRVTSRRKTLHPKNALTAGLSQLAENSVSPDLSP